jgi:hypothetical protein
MSAQLERIIAKRSPEMATLTREVLATMRSRLPGATELVYDKKNSLVIGFCPDDRASDVINSVAVYARWINLYFFEGDALPDPEGLLQGEGSMVRYIRLTSADDLNRAAVKALMKAALKAADVPLKKGAKRRVIIRQSQ